MAPAAALLTATLSVGAPVAPVAASLTAALSVGAPMAIVWAEGNAKDSERAMESWFALRDRGALPDVALRAGYPTVVPDPALDAPPGWELVVLGVCDEPQAERIVRVLRSLRPSIRTRDVQALRAAPRSACPTLTAMPAASVAEALADASPHEQQRRERARASVALCPHERDALVERHGDDYLCLALWGVDCATYGSAAAASTPPARDRCRFLLGSTKATTLATERAGAGTVTVCTAAPDDGVAIVFTRSRDGVVDVPADVLCGHGPGYSTRLGALRAFGDGVCLEATRRLSSDSDAGPGDSLQVGLHCWVPLADPPYARADAVYVDTARGGPLRYAVTGEGTEAFLCLRHGRGAEARAWALRMGERGLVAAAAPDVCASVTPIELPR